MEEPEEKAKGVKTGPQWCSLTSWVWGDEWGKEQAAEGAIEKGTSLFDLS